MIPRRMEAFLRQRLSEQTWENRLRRVGTACFMEFGPLDLDRLARLGIQVDRLGPELVVVMWDEASPLEVGGYLVVDNLAMGRPSIGGIRMLADITPNTVCNLARGMTMKNAAAHLPFGGGKAGIVAERSLTPREHSQVVRSFANLLYHYRELFLPGPDVGTNDADMKTIAIESGLDNAVSKPVEMGGNRVDQLGAAAGGMIIALEALLTEMPRLKDLPQFADLEIPRPEDLTVIIQGFGAVGAHTARILVERLPGARVIGISDGTGYLFDEAGLPVKSLFEMWQEKGRVTQDYFQEYLQPANRVRYQKYSNAANDLLRESAFCLIPAAPVANYLAVDAASQPAMTVAGMGKWSVIIEGANTYSPEPARKAARARMEIEVYRTRGTLIVTDYLVNSGGVIFAAQERMIKTPPSLRIPDEVLGDRKSVDAWLVEHASDLSELADKRRQAAEACREEVIRRNIHELIDLLASDQEMLPCDAAENISTRRIASSERGRTAADIMLPIVTIQSNQTVRETAARLVQANSSILAVVSSSGDLVGIVTEWDITRATAIGSLEDQPVERVMTADVISARPDESILDVIRRLEACEISAMPVVDGGKALGKVTTELLARRSLLRLLQKEI